MMLGLAGNAQAGIAIGPGGIKRFGDPFYYYIVKVYLEPNTAFQVGDDFKLFELAGVRAGGSATISPNGNPGDPSGPWTPVLTNRPDGLLPNFSPPTTVHFADAEFRNAGSTIVNAGTSDIYLGQFEVLTAQSLPLLPKSYTVTLSWTADVHDLNGNPITDGGTVTLGQIVPEPASLALLGSGLMLPLGWYLRRRRRIA
jgi:hypothetical protein